MNYTLAQLQNVDADFLKSFLLVIVGLLSGAAGVVGILKTKRKIEPQPLEVRASTEYATIGMVRDADSKILQRVDDHSEQLRMLSSTIREDKASAEEAASKHRAGIYKKIDDVQKEMNSGFQRIERALGRLEGKVEE